MPRLARGNGYDLVIRHLAVGRVSFGGILEDSTYTFCQMSYDVGHDPSIVSQTEVFRASRNFIPYARYKTSFERRKSGLHTTPVPREKLRSEEHTSELQSLAYLVCRLLLEK